MLDHIGAVYAKKRSMISDKKAVDEFSRNKGEELESCLQRAEIVIDKLKVLHSETAWPEIKLQLKRKILMQVIAEEVKKFILAEENEAIENTGIPIAFNKMVKLAAKYERQTGKTPEYHATFEQQIDQVPRGKSKRKEFIQEVVQEILANPMITKSDRIPK